eukprot:g40147.t1
MWLRLLFILLEVVAASKHLPKGKDQSTNQNNSQKGTALGSLPKKNFTLIVGHKVVDSHSHLANETVDHLKERTESGSELNLVESVESLLYQLKHMEQIHNSSSRELHKLFYSLNEIAMSNLTQRGTKLNEFLFQTLPPIAGVKARGSGKEDKLNASTAVSYTQHLLNGYKEAITLKLESAQARLG